MNVLITGAGKGIGWHVAHRMAAKGYDVIATVHSRNRITSDCLPGVVIEMDVTSDADVQAVAEKVAGLDVLINNAIIQDFALDLQVLTVSMDLVQRSFEVNALGALRVAQAFAPALARVNGRIINVSSVWGQLTGSITSTHPAYRTSKAALNMMTTMLAAAFKNKVAVNSICPSNATSIEAAADEIIWLAEFDRRETGKFFNQRQSIPW